MNNFSLKAIKNKDLNNFEFINGCRIYVRRYYDRGKIVVNLDC